MYKLILLFHKPTAPDADYQLRWSTEFVPLADQLPGLRRVIVSHVQGGPSGPAEVELIHELYFDSREALLEAMGSPAGVAAGQCLVRLTHDQPGAVTMLFADHMEDAPPGPRAG
jgi:uncharacterized protein (TIGR02118 family)